MKKQTGDLGKIMGGGKDVNLEQIKVGMAWHYKAYERTQSVIDSDNFYL